MMGFHGNQSHIKEIECVTCGATKRWAPVDANTAQERTAFIMEHGHGAEIYADTDS